jgi:hypothetical protein
MKIQLHVERLVLDEMLLQGERATSVRTALEHELAALLGQAGTADPFRRIGIVDALPAISLRAANRPGERLGSRVAAAVGQGLGLSGGRAHPHAIKGATGAKGKG